MERKYNLDVLKFIGIFCIVLAHVKPPTVLFQLRNFDVILMIMISSYLYFISTNKQKFSTYIFKRFNRLVIPTWIFLTIFFIINYFFKFQKVDLKIIIDSFILNDGIKYVWIVRIYMIVALLLPFVKYLIDKFNINYIYFFSAFVYIIYEILCYLGLFNNIILNYLFAYVVPCYIVILITYFIINSDSKKVLKFSFLNFLVFVVLMVIIYFELGVFKNTNYMKYPFRLYYLSYAIALSGLLIVIFRNNKITNLFYNKFIGFMSNNSLWFYLWHILFVKTIKFESWILTFIVIFGLTFMVVYIQGLIIKLLEKRNVNKKILNLFKG